MRDHLNRKNQKGITGKINTEEAYSFSALNGEKGWRWAQIEDRLYMHADIF